MGEQNKNQGPQRTKKTGACPRVMWLPCWREIRGSVNTIMMPVLDFSLI